MKKILLALLLGMFLISLVSAEIQTLGTFPQGEEINLIQTCANCTFNNITSVIGSDSQQIIGNFPMTKTGSVYNFTLTSGNTTQLGEYIVNGIGDLDGVDTVWNYNLFVTPNGQNFTTGKAISYIGFIIILLFSFLLTLYGAYKVRWKHLRNDENKIITINDFRYVKVFLFAIAYSELMFLFGLSYKFFREANIEGFPEFFNFIYQLFLNLMYPLIVFLIIVVFVIWINNKKLSKNLNLGLDR
ncbi:hypothetical protein LCGC14_0868750 [marine sediment metagenome]|uniref:Uncharacterized protein n=1 Tax=marine sediment metagenome TaxID=412755 RepID=A0A0F9PA40_9ZZZZ